MHTAACALANDRCAAARFGSLAQHDARIGSPARASVSSDGSRFWYLRWSGLVGRLEQPRGEARSLAFFDDGGSKSFTRFYLDVGRGGGLPQWVLKFLASDSRRLGFLARGPRGKAI